METQKDVTYKTPFHKTPSIIVSLVRFGKFEDFINTEILLFRFFTIKEDNINLHDSQ